MMNGTGVGVDLAEVKEILLLYCEALTGRSIQILSTHELAYKGIGWTSVDKPTTEGTTIFLPPRSDGFSSARENFDFYKVLVTHQASHLEFGTFAFSFDRPAYIFEDCRPLLVAECPSSASPISDFEVFFDLFDDRRLAEDLFVVAEDTRVDALLRRNYKGIRQSHAKARLHSASKRTPIHFLPFREAFLEALVQLSLETDKVFAFPLLYLNDLKLAASILRCLMEPVSLVEDAAEATIRLYCLLSEIPNVILTNMPTVQVNCHELLNGANLDGVTTRDQWLKRFRANPTHPELVGEKNYAQAEDVLFRGGLKPELVQTIMQLLEVGAGGEQGDGDASGESLERMIDKSVEVETETPDSSYSYDYDPVADNLRKVLEKAKHLRPSKKDSHGKTRQKALAIAAAGEEVSFYYDEWDFRANSYRVDWCRVRQRTLAEGPGRFYENALGNHSTLLAQIKRQFSLLRPEGYKRVRGLQDGEEVDFDAVVEAMVDRRAGQAQSDGLYTRRRKTHRDVSVVFLLDMSASTGEYIRDKQPHMESVKSDNGKNTTDKRIIDIETESLVLLTNALESLGDKYGIYGFSGSGRDNVQFFVIKDLNERLSERVKQRIDNIAPVRGTRMGPAIRHSISILECEEAKTRLLILISDGRPQDLDYGQDPRELPFGGPLYHLKYAPLIEDDEGLREKEYVIHDTKMALLEARQRGIVPYCISIDKFGRDYLRLMCGDIGYEVVDNVEALPRHLPSLYRRLTA